MTRVTIVIAVSAVLVAGNAMAQTTQTTPPPTQTTPPPTQTTPPPVTIPQTNPAQQKPTVPPPTPKPTPVPFPPEAKVAYIDLQVVVRDSKLGKSGQESMKVLNDKLASQLADQNKEIQALQDKMKTQQGVVSDAVINSMAKELEKMGREAQFIQQDAQVQIDQKNAELLRGLPGEGAADRRRNPQGEGALDHLCARRELQHRGGARRPRPLAGHRQASRRHD